MRISDFMETGNLIASAIAIDEYVSKEMEL